MPRIALKLVLAGLAGALAGWLMWSGTTTHLRRACLLMDTPYLPLCAQQSAGTHPNREPAALQARLRDNPGDSDAWVTLATLESGASREPILRAIGTLAPSDPDSLLLRARDALARDDMPQATALLVEMTNNRIGGAEPPRTLAHLLASDEGTALLRPHLVAGSRWLPQVLQAMTALKLPLESGLALLAEAGPKGAATPDTVQAFVRSLKAAGKWADAYALWLSLQRQPAPLLFNGSFDQSFQSDGFDWEVTRVAPARAGALVAQRSVARHGQVLETQYNGKAVAMPIVRQYLFVPPGRHVLQGQYMSTKLRMEQGLAWAVRCTDAPKTLAGRSGALLDTAGAWQRFQFEFDIPATCGAVASLQLETFAGFEAAAGFRGNASFDGFELRRLEP